MPFSCLLMRRIGAALMGGFACLVLAACALGDADQAARAPVILAASSLQESLEEAGRAFAARGNVAPSLSFASSAALARQIEYGAPADVFISADQAWMDRVDNLGLLDQGRVNLLSNRLVLIVPIADDKPQAGKQPVDIIGEARIAIGDVESVPAGRYAKILLSNLGLWGRLKNQMVGSENVRAALALVERGEAEFGIVYATDAQASARVRIAYEFAQENQPEITYPMAMVAAGDSPQKAQLFAFLASDEARQIFARHGFAPAPSSRARSSQVAP